MHSSLWDRLDDEAATVLEGERGSAHAERFVVRTVSGAMGAAVNGRLKFGVSAHVCDTLYGFAVVATYRSEDRIGQFGRLGVDRAVAVAEGRAERLNRG